MDMKSSHLDGVAGQALVDPVFHVAAQRLVREPSQSIGQDNEQGEQPQQPQPTPAYRQRHGRLLSREGRYDVCLSRTFTRSRPASLLPAGFARAASVHGGPATTRAVSKGGSILSLISIPSVCFPISEHRECQRLAISKKRWLHRYFQSAVAPAMQRQCHMSPGKNFTF